MISDKVPGSLNPPSPLQNKDFNGFIATTSPKLDYAERRTNPLQATSPVENQVDTTMNTHPMEIGQGVQGVINTEVNANTGGTAAGHIGSFDFGVK